MYPTKQHRGYKMATTPFGFFFDNDFLRDAPFTPFKSWDMPKSNIRESAEKFVIELAAPGYTKTDFNISVSNNRLSVEAIKKGVEQLENEKFTRKEFHQNGFKRTFTLPEDLVQEDQITASYTDGILYVTVPKKEHTVQNGPKTIPVV